MLISDRETDSWGVRRHPGSEIGHLRCLGLRQSNRGIVCHLRAHSRFCDECIGGLVKKLAADRDPLLPGTPPPAGRLQRQQWQLHDLLEIRDADANQAKVAAWFKFSLQQLAGDTGDDPAVVRRCVQRLLPSERGEVRKA